MSPELLQAVKERLELGYTPDAIKDELRAAGYNEEVLDQVLLQASGAAGPSPIPSPVQAGEEVAQGKTLALPAISKLVSNAFSFATSRLDMVALLAVPYVVFAFLDYSSTGTMPGSNAFALGAGIFGLLAFFAYIAALMMLLYTVAHNDRRVSLGESFDWAKKNIGGLIWLSLLSLLVVAGGFMLFIVPGIIISVYVYFSQYVYIQEGKRGMDALLRSRELVYGHWWDVALKLAGVTLVLFGVFLVIGFIVGIGTYVIEGHFGEFIFTLVSDVFSAGATIFSLHIGFSLYQSLAAAKTGEVVNAPKKKYVFLAIVGLLFPIMVGILVIALVGLNDAMEEGKDAALRMNVSNARATAEIYYNGNNSSFEGVCEELESTVMRFSVAKYSDCIDAVDTWALSVTNDADQQSCVDANGAIVSGGVDDVTGLCQNTTMLDMNEAKQRASELRNQEIQIPEELNW